MDHRVVLDESSRPLVDCVFTKACFGNNFYFSFMLGLMDFNNIALLHGYSSWPAFSQFDWLIIGQDSAILPDGFSCSTKLTTHVDQSFLKILGKLRKIINLGKMLFVKLVSNYFSENYRLVFGQFSGKLKSTKNLRKMIFVKKFFSENCR